MRNSTYTIITLALLLLSLGVAAQGLKWSCEDTPAPPRSEGLVIQYKGASLLSKTEEARLQQKLLNYEDTTSTQILVIVVPTLCGDDPNRQAAKIGQSWGIGGNEQKDNGIVLLIKPRTGNAADERGQVSIQLGTGMEGAITAPMAGRIIDNIIVPAFRNGEFYRGIDRATDAMISMASGQYEGTGTESEMPLWVIILIIAIIVLFFYIASKADDDGGPTTTYSGRGWSTGRRGGWTWSSGGSSWGGGGSSWGGGGGGGFGGFGGGGFSGGGASGSW